MAFETAWRWAESYSLASKIAQCAKMCRYAALALRKHPKNENIRKILQDARWDLVQARKLIDQILEGEQ